MKNKINNYKKRTYFFRCKWCGRNLKEDREFNFVHYQKIKGAVLKCKNCGQLISKKIKFLDKQIEEKEKRKDFMTLNGGRLKLKSGGVKKEKFLKSF